MQQSFPVDPNKSVCPAPKEKTFVESVVDKSVIENLKSCIICTTMDVLTIEKLIAMLEEKRLVEFDVQKLSGNQFLLDFDREEMVSQCLNWEWDCLPLIFSKISRWNHGYTPEDRVT
ncbi:hypothetical protein V6N11_002199 [Hibiscus sabdariffa]|uniref:DUF4283 domain-containing protein n=1 Tax=Hibiscus sabdariffa TaxID=183260 RepID=A0ABR2QUP3_9ROSI